MRILKVLGTIGVVVILFYIFPIWTTLASWYSTVANLVYTPSSLDQIFFAALPILGFALVLYFGWKMYSGRWNRRG